MKFSLNSASGVPFYRQIIQQIERAVLSGMLQPGYKLPTIRSLAIELKINPNTIARAYSELEIKGVVTTQVGSGTFISDATPEPDETERNNEILKTVSQFLNELKALNVSDNEIPDLIRKCQEES
ncbi:MAG: GntR family transcriptional regulator [Spirochaetes bacterium]|jgi:GntR family transcriptional regulator|nr:GntR family transcriptional regulator [Spirochaetota bacterium]